jgi:hypothetical protein
MKILEHNVTTGEAILRDMTKDEADQYKKDQAATAARMVEEEARATAKAALLERLGITADEATLLLG